MDFYSCQYRAQPLGDALFSLVVLAWLWVLEPQLWTLQVAYLMTPVNPSHTNLDASGVMQCSGLLLVQPRQQQSFKKKKKKKPLAKQNQKYQDQTQKKKKVWIGINAIITLFIQII